MLYRHLQHHNDAIIKQTNEDFFINICTSHFICNVWNGYSKFACERELETEQKLQYFDPHSYGRQRCVFSFSWCSTGGPGPTLLDDGFLYCILSASSPDLNSSGPQGPKAWCGFPYHNSSITPSPTGTGTRTVWLLSWLSYIIVQLPLSRLLDFWNLMLDHQAEITVMQFTGHSLPGINLWVYHGNFFTSSHFIS